VVGTHTLPAACSSGVASDASSFAAAPASLGCFLAASFLALSRLAYGHVAPLRHPEAFNVAQYR
jgi:hypothetical protein